MNPMDIRRWLGTGTKRPRSEPAAFPPHDDVVSRRMTSSMRDDQTIRTHLPEWKSLVSQSLVEGNEGERAELQGIRMLVLLCHAAATDEAVASWMERTLGLPSGYGKRCVVQSLDTRQLYQANALADVEVSKRTNNKCDTAVLQVSGMQSICPSMKFRGGGNPSLMNTTARCAPVFWGGDKLAPYLDGMDTIVQRANALRRNGNGSEYALGSLCETAKERESALQFIEYFALDGSGHAASSNPANCMWDLGTGDPLDVLNWTFTRCCTPTERRAWARSILPRIVMEIRGPDRPKQGRALQLRGMPSRKQLEKTPELGAMVEPWVYYPKCYESPMLRGALTLRIH